MQERRASEALAALRKMTAPTARVRRDGAVLVVPAEDVVPGDVLLLEAGDAVAADVRLVSSSSLTTVEATLTGESEPVPKDAAAEVPAEAPVGDRRTMAWTGTIVVGGAAEGVVVSTGGNTEFGRIAALVHETEEPETPLQGRLRVFGHWLAGITVVVVALIAGLDLLRGRPPVETLLAALGLAVAAVPEGLPAVVTITLALGVRRMAARNTLVRHLAAVETLGGTTVICTDKTGTLTAGRLALRSVAAPETPEDWSADAPDAARTLVRAAVAASTARLSGDDFVGDPTEGAVLVAARAVGVEADAIETAEPTVTLHPFDADRKRMSIVRRGATGVQVYVKGAPESVLPLCVRVVGAAGPEALDAAGRERLAAVVDDLAARALRVLAVAVRSADADPGDAAESSLDLLGFIGLQDPPRTEARAAVAACGEAGIRVVMITGDHPATALAIARELGIADRAEQVTTGPDVALLDDAALAARAPEIAVYARTSPEQKLRIVRAWKARGAVVAMTGDGVNDAPALRASDIGVAMGRAGTDVAKAASAMVVTDDDFSTIVAAVEEGRAIYDNIRKTLLYLLSGNAAEIVVVAAAALAGLPPVLAAVQLLWINLVTDGLPALALATDPAESGLLQRPPRAPDAGIADRPFLRQLALSALLDSVCVLGAYFVSLRIGRPVEEARAVAFATLVLAQVLRAFAFRSRDRVLWELGAFSNMRLVAVAGVTIGLQTAAHTVPAFGAVLRTAQLDLSHVVLVVGLGLVPVSVLEILKLLRRWWRRPEALSA